jgi:hypothetical protein
MQELRDDHSAQGPAQSKTRGGGGIKQIHENTELGGGGGIKQIHENTELGGREGGDDCITQVWKTVRHRWTENRKI